MYKFLAQVLFKICIKFAISYLFNIPIFLKYVFNKYCFRGCQQTRYKCRFKYTSKSIR